MLADSAQADQAGKAHALGLGWSVTTTPSLPMALVILIEIDWTEANQKHHITAELVDADGHSFMVVGPTGELTPIRFDADFEVGRPPGLPHGSPLAMPLAVNIGGGLPLLPEQRYRWKVTNTGQPGADLGASFSVAAPQ
ncbi:hypothetical protein GCM10009655_23150 [Rhodoglobus aureus]|uniref:Uncharacterized protein n=1 Tax=Rhodoglobus aureus TaxID=191497 RepID=A0ABN1VXG1_9MICO